MIEKYSRQIQESEDIVEISDILMGDPLFQDHLSRCADTPCDERIRTWCGLAGSARTAPAAFARKGDTIYLVGQTEPGIRADSPDACPGDPESAQVLAECIARGLVTSIRALSPDGLFVSLAESCAPGQLGFDITGDAEIPDKEFLFGPSRYLALVTVTEKQENALVDCLFNHRIPITLLGHVTKGELRMDEISFGYISDFTA